MLPLNILHTFSIKKLPLKMLQDSHENTSCRSQAPHLFIAHLPTTASEMNSKHILVYETSTRIYRLKPAQRRIQNPGKHLTSSF